MNIKFKKAPNNISEFLSTVFIFLREAMVPINF